MIFLDINDGELDWHIIHEMDDDNGKPTEWSAALSSGEFLWIDKEEGGYALYDTHHTDASPVSVSETLDGAKESGEDYALELNAASEEEVKKTTVALESSEDFQSRGLVFIPTSMQMAGKKSRSARLGLGYIWTISPMSLPEPMTGM